MNWRQVVETLELAPHPEGGYFRETFRDTALDGDGRSRSTAIYFLLPDGVISRWHRVDAVEVWHWYAGSTLSLSETIGDSEPDLAQAREIILGPDLLIGERPQHVIAAHAWQQARSLGNWTLVGCTVAPAFEFSGFELAPD